MHAWASQHDEAILLKELGSSHLGQDKAVILEELRRAEERCEAIELVQACGEHGTLFSYGLNHACADHRTAGLHAGAHQTG